MRRVKLEYCITYLDFGIKEVSVILHVERDNLIAQIQEICNHGGTIYKVDPVIVEIN